MHTSALPREVVWYERIWYKSAPRGGMALEEIQRSSFITLGMDGTETRGVVLSTR